jgi:tetratricopeptide (TPR) repeat protein
MRQFINGLCILIAGSLFIISCGGTKTVATSNTTSSSKKASTEAYFEAGKARLNKENDKAKKLYLQSLDGDASNHAAWFYLAKIVSKEGDHKQALSYIEKAVALQPNNKFYIELQAEELGNTNAYGKSAEKFSQLADLDKKLSERYLNMSAYYFMKDKQLSKSIATYDKIEKLYGSDNEDIIIRKIAIYKSLENNTAVIKEYDKLIAINPKSIKAYLDKLAFLKQIKDEKGLAEIKNIIETQFSNDGNKLSTDAIAAWKTGDTLKYISIAEKAVVDKEMDLRSKIDLLSPYFVLASVIPSRAKSLENITKEIYLSDKSKMASDLYAQSLIINKKYNEAAEIFKPLLKSSPSSLENWNVLIDLYSSSKLYDSALVYSKKAMDLFPTNASVYFSNGLLNQQISNYPAAIKSLNKAIEFGESTAMEPEAWSALGDVYNSTKQFKQSDSAFEKALSLENDNATTLNNYAYYLSVRGQNLDKAETMSKKSLDLRKGETTFLDTYAWILFKQKKYEEAEKIMKPIATAADAGAEYLEHYGDILSMLKRTDEAKKYWKKAKENGSKSSALDNKMNTGIYAE